MKKILCLFLMMITLSFTACSASWTDKDKEIKSSASVEITCYDINGNVTEVRTLSDEREVNNICHTFSLLAVKRTRAKEAASKSFHIRFLDDGGNEIESITLFHGSNRIESNGKSFKITDESDINRHIEEILNTQNPS